MTLPLFALKEYQLHTLASLRRFLEKTVELNDADTAFYAITKRPFIAPPSMPGLPVRLSPHSHRRWQDRARRALRERCG